MKHLFPEENEALVSGSILLSNIYTSLGDYERAEDIRLTRIKEFGTKVKPGATWTEVNGELVVRYIFSEFQTMKKNNLLFF